MSTTELIRIATEQATAELAQVASLGERHLLVVGASSSEVAGERIGTAGSAEIAAAILAGVFAVQAELGFQVAFQSCEHLNRALVVERSTLERFSLVEVSAVPVATAGGAVATAAFLQLRDPALAEQVVADAGLDIGATLIGMHLRRVAVPVRLAVSFIGKAHVTAARTRPPLIGGERAVYDRPKRVSEC